MVANGHEEIADVLNKVANWPLRDRIILARKILETVDSIPSLPRRGYTAEQVVALLNVPQPVPDDQECQQIVEEIVRKYGP